MVVDANKLGKIDLIKGLEKVIDGTLIKEEADKYGVNFTDVNFSSLNQKKLKKLFKKYENKGWTVEPFETDPIIAYRFYKKN
ncbi:MAG: hypothetical protein KC516_04415 [Nanoarchaeota archaeon]|nr:hypothetical protein [Nanoarchaeota archaeon]